MEKNKKKKKKKKKKRKRSLIFLNVIVTWQKKLLNEL